MNKIKLMIISVVSIMLMNCAYNYKKLETSHGSGYKTGHGNKKASGFVDTQLGDKQYLVEYIGVPEFYRDSVSIFWNKRAQELCSSDDFYSKSVKYKRSYSYKTKNRFRRVSVWDARGVIDCNKSANDSITISQGVPVLPVVKGHDLKPLRKAIKATGLPLTPFEVESLLTDALIKIPQ
jgi:hypothetical protein